MTHIGPDEKIFFMRIFFTVILLIFSIQSFTKADDIKDFQIEGMSIGENLLNFYEEKTILNLKKDFYTNDQFMTSSFRTALNSDKFDSLQISYDQSFKIYEIEGAINFISNNNNCIKKFDEIYKEISSIFPRAKKSDLVKRKLNYDKSGQSIVTGRQIYFKGDDYIQIACFDISKKLEEQGYIDVLKLTLTSRKFADWRQENTKSLN